MVNSTESPQRWPTKEGSVDASTVSQRRGTWDIHTMGLKVIKPKIWELTALRLRLA